MNVRCPNCGFQREATYDEQVGRDAPFLCPNSIGKPAARMEPVAIEGGGQR